MERLVVWLRWIVAARDDAEEARAAATQARAVAARLVAVGGDVLMQLSGTVVATFDPADLGDALDALRADGWSFVTLDAAMSDPAYALPDVYTSTFGPSWLHRIAPMLQDEFAWEKAKEAEVRALVGG